MSHVSKHLRVLSWVLAGAFALEGCAGTPKPAPAPVAAPPPAEPERPAIIQMAPIPNPEPSKPTHRWHPAPSAHHPAQPAKPAEEEAPSKPSPPAAPVVNHARAAQLRAAGLEQLDRGAINRAVALLREASQLDPTNALIQRDLDRAIRISNAVHSKR